MVNNLMVFLAINLDQDHICIIEDYKRVRQDFLAATPEYFPSGLISKEANLINREKLLHPQFQTL